MSLVIELAIDIARNNSITNIKTLLVNLADNYDSSYHYFLHEVEGKNSKISHNDCIHVIEFEYSSEYMRENIIQYIKAITRYKYIKIDCIYDDIGKINILYASKRYRMKSANLPTNLTNLNNSIDSRISEILNKLI
jgi:hypothetical protein